MRITLWLLLVALRLQRHVVDALLWVNVGTIDRFRLINADSNQPIMDLQNDQIVILSKVKATNFNIDVTTAGGKVGSVKFSYLGKENYNTEWRPPYSLCGVHWWSRQYNACSNFLPGTHVITATPYYLGRAGTPVRITFTVRTDVVPVTAAPRNPPTRAPSQIPNSPPVQSPTKIEPPPQPSLPTTRAPIKMPNSSPVQSPTKNEPPPTLPTTRRPIQRPTLAPRPPPTPRNVPMMSPVKRPVSSPTWTTKDCAIPKFTEDWQISGPRYPLGWFAEPQGLFIGNDLVIFSGFINDFANATNQTYARTVTDPNSTWRRMDDMPIDQGVTHAATIVVGTKAYLCGGYRGGHPGPHVPYCFVYDHSRLPGRKQWTKLMNLPNGGSAGGGMIYDSDSNTLFYAGGGQRLVAGSKDPVDIDNTWKLSLSSAASGWVASTPLPYRANHLSSVTHTDDRGTERHFFLGGQEREDECCSNIDLNYEFIARTETWVRRASMPIPRGHATSSTRPFGCGFIIAGGSTNSVTTKKNRTDDISYYDLPTDTWTMAIGKLPNAGPTPIVDIHRDGYMYYVTRSPDQSRRRISIG